MRRDLDVVADREREVEGAAAGEAGQDLRQERELQRLHGRAPARTVAEQVDDPGRLAVVVVPAQRLDPDLAAQGDRVDADAGPLLGAHLQHDVGPAA